jgi:adhesin/invasin
MNGWISTVFKHEVARGCGTTGRHFATWMMVLTVLTLNSLAPRNASAQAGALDASTHLATPGSLSANSDSFCAPLPLSLACGPVQTAIEDARMSAGYRAADPAAVDKSCTRPVYSAREFADACSHLNLPDLGEDSTDNHRSTSKQEDKNAIVAPLLQQLAQAGQIAGTGQGMGDIATGLITSRANQYAFGGLQQWLSQFGTAGVSMNVDDHGRLNDGSTNVLLPLYDNKGSTLLFTQLGYQRWDSRNTINLGLGARHFGKNSMYGVNTFFDDDLTGHNERFGAGVEFGTDYLRVSANGYLGLTGWHQSLDYADYEERPANGFDLTSQMYLPSLPQLGVKLKFEQYFGSGVDLFGTGSFEKNPFAITAGLDYTPVPAITVGAAYSKGTGGMSDVLFNVQLNYRMGVPLSEQFDPRAVASMRTLAGSRYDLVQRNNRIVLNYRKRVVIRLTLGPPLNGYPGEVAPLPVNVTSTYGLQSIQWDAPELIAHGGAITGQNGSYTLTFPPYQAGGTNTYTVSAVATDRQGNASAPAQMQVTVQSATQNVNPDKSITDISPNRIDADGHSTSILTITVLDSNGNGVSGLAQEIDLQPSFLPSTGSPSGPGTVPRPPTIGNLTAQGNGIYVATITAGTELGTLTVNPVLKTENIRLKSATLQLVAENSSVNPQITGQIAVTPQAIQPADGQAAYTYTAHVIDSNTGKSLPNYPLVGLRWQVNPQPSSLLNAGWLILTPGSSTTDNNGNITATLKSKIANTQFTVSAQLEPASPSNAQPVTFSVVARVASLTIVDPATGATETTTLTNALNTLVLLHAPLPLNAAAQAGFQFIAHIVDARGVPVANQSLSSLGFKWNPSRAVDPVNDRYVEQQSTDGSGQAIAYFASVAQTGTTGPFTLSAQLGSQPAVSPAAPQVVAFSDIPGDTQIVEYTDAAGNPKSLRIAVSSATVFVKDVTYLRLDPTVFNPQTDTFVSSSSSQPGVISVNSAGLMNALTPGSATVTEVFAHNGFRFTRSVPVTAHTVLFVPYYGGAPVQIQSPAARISFNTCETWGPVFGMPGMASVTANDVTTLLSVLPQSALGIPFWGSNPPPSQNQRFFVTDPTAADGWSSLQIPGSGGLVTNDRNDGTLVCKFQ